MDKGQVFEREFLQTGKLSEPLCQVARRSAELAASLGLDDSASGRAALGVIQIVMEELSGGVYIPDVKTLERLERDCRIRRDFTGANHRELAEREGLSTKRIRQILSY